MVKKFVDWYSGNSGKHVLSSIIGYKLTLYIQSIKLTTNFFSETCSSLLTLKIHGVEAKIVQTTTTKSSNSASENPDQEDSSVDTLQKIVSSLAYVKFLVTFSLENVHVYVENTKFGFATASVSKADFYTGKSFSEALFLVSTNPQKIVH